MSRRHQGARAGGRTSKQERRRRTHQERQAVREALTAAGDPEEILTPRTVHHGPRSPESLAAPGRRRHWKLKAWKRRSVLRRRRALAEARAALRTPPGIS